jgi:hypothetical protein
MTDPSSSTGDHPRTPLGAALLLAGLGTALGYVLAQGLAVARSSVELTLVPNELHALWLGLVLTIAIIAAIGR